MHNCSTLLTSNLKFLHSTYMSVKLQSNVGCLNVGLPILAPAFVSLLLAS